MTRRRGKVRLLDKLWKRVVAFAAAVAVVGGLVTAGRETYTWTKDTGTEHPKRRSTVVVHYSGWTTDGKLFDSSVLRGQTAQFGLDAVITGWTEGLQLMVEGEKTRFWIPAKLAYGKERGKPQGMLVFDIELIDIVK